MENGNNRDASPGDSPVIGRSRSRSHSHQRSRKQVSRSRSRSRSKEREHRRKKRGSESPKRSHYQNSNYYGSRGNQGEFRGEFRGGRYGGGGGYQQYGGSRGYSSRGFGGRNYNSSYNNDHNGYVHRESPPEGRCLGVFGLSVDTNEKKLRHYFEEFGGLEDIQLVYDAKTGGSRGFAFIYYENVSSAKHAKEKLNGIEIDGRKIRVDFSITQHAHTPTPGIYMGRHNSRARSNYYSSGHNSRYDYPRDYESRDRYPVKRRFSRSRSRSPTRKAGYHSYEDKPFRRSHYPSSGFKDDYSRY